MTVMTISATPMTVPTGLDGVESVSERRLTYFWSSSRKLPNGPAIGRRMKISTSTISWSGMTSSQSMAWMGPTNGPSTCSSGMPLRITKGAATGPTSIAMSVTSQRQPRRVG